MKKVSKIEVGGDTIVVYSIIAGAEAINTLDFHDFWKSYIVKEKLNIIYDEDTDSYEEMGQEEFIALNQFILNNLIRKWLDLKPSFQSKR
jgi:hypothetical protein